MNTTIDDLDAALRSDGASTVLAGAWEALDLGVRVADAVTWDGSGDELLALTAAQECAAARALLPLPATGQPLPLDPVDISAGADGLAPFAALLDRAHRALAGLAEGDAQLTAATHHAAAAAAALAAVREQ
ncbi:hypothetical protein AB0M10_29005 [Streptomyces sp. NPDC051840]|uniref:hypothetical protein n=1 Tax=Streptomyces sp. NPDC051840 TaxID=3154752 RepID=UPI00341E67ED